MNTRQMAAVAALIPFLLLTLYAIVEVGYAGIFEHFIIGPAGWQIFADLVIALVMVLIWLYRDARQRGRNPWPWIVGTLFTGSIAPLLYLSLRKE